MIVVLLMVVIFIVLLLDVYSAVDGGDVNDAVSGGC